MSEQLCKNCNKPIERFDCLVKDWIHSADDKGYRFYGCYKGTPGVFRNAEPESYRDQATRAYYEWLERPDKKSGVDIELTFKAGYEAGRNSK